MINKTYLGMSNQIVPDKYLIEKTRAAMKSELIRTKGKHIILFRGPLAWAAAICICIVVSIPVMAATIPSFSNLLYIVSPEISQLLQPIEISSESNGIKMEVIAAMNDDDTAVVYLTLQDLTGDRVDKTVDLYNYYIHGSSSFTHQLVNYDEETKIATIRMIASGGNNLNGKKVTVQLDSFLSGREVYDGVNLNVDMQDIPKTEVETILLDLNNINGGGGIVFKKLMKKQYLEVLKPNQIETQINSDINFLSISGIGYSGGFLHIQTDWKESIDNHGYISLVNKDGNKVDTSASLSFDIDDNGNATYGKRYQEALFQIPESEIGNYSLYGDFTENKNYVEGNWNVTFKIKAVDDSRALAKDLDINGMKIDEFSITPIGIEIVGNAVDAEDLNIEVTMNNGSIITFDYSISKEDNGAIIGKYISEFPIDILNIKEVKINSNTIPIDKIP